MYLSFADFVFKHTMDLYFQLFRTTVNYFYETFFLNYIIVKIDLFDYSCNRMKVEVSVKIEEGNKEFLSEQ